MSKVIKFPNWVESQPRVVFHPEKWAEEDRRMAETSDEDEDPGETSETLDPSDEARMVEDTEDDPLNLPPTPEEIAEQIRREIQSQAELEKAQVLSQAREMAEKILAEARVEASHLKEEAATQAETVKAEAKRLGWEEGRQDGQEHGFEEGRREAAEKFGQVQSLLEEVAAGRNRILAEAGDEILKLVVSFAEKIVRRELLLDKKAILRTLQEAITMVNDSRQLLIRVNPEDSALVREMKEKFRVYLPDSATVEFVADERVENGGCLIETEIGNVDARVETQIAALVEQLKEVNGDGR